MSRNKCSEGDEPGQVRQHSKLKAASESLVRAATGQMNLSARGYRQVLRQESTMAELAVRRQIQVTHLAEASHLRQTQGIHAICLVLDDGGVSAQGCCCCVGLPCNAIPEFGSPSSVCRVSFQSTALLAVVPLVLPHSWQFCQTN
jgi:hypothetical protein